MAAEATSSFNKIERAHQLYRDGRHEEALGVYTDALAIAKNKAQKIALHSNRAACYLKLHDFKKVWIRTTEIKSCLSSFFCFSLSFSSSYH